MAVINRTPDSFYDEGRRYFLPDALRAVDAAVASGADIVDIGGVKAAPGPEVSVDQEIERVAPLIAEIRSCTLMLSSASIPGEVRWRR
jgi:dihydropteroate synthase